MIRAKLTLIAVLCAASFAAGYSRHEIKPVDHIVIAETRIPVCAPLLVPRDRQAWVGKQRDIIAAAIPARALRHD